MTGGIDEFTMSGETVPEGSVRSRLNRRALLGLLGQGAVVVAIGGLLQAAGRNGTYVRPPGALPEDELLATCLKCRRCLEICPTAVIAPVLMSESAAGAGTPKMQFRDGYCTLCMKCIEVCPTGTLQPVGKDAARLGIAVVDANRCVAWYWRGCTKCLKECPLEAISLDEAQRPVVEAGKCNGCGLCEYICPAPQLRSYTKASGKGIRIRPSGTTMFG